MQNDRWYGSWFGAPPQAFPARDTNGLDRWKVHRSRPLVLLSSIFCVCEVGLQQHGLWSVRTGRDWPWRWSARSACQSGFLPTPDTRAARPLPNCRRATSNRWWRSVVLSRSALATSVHHPRPRRRATGVRRAGLWGAPGVRVGDGRILLRFVGWYVRKKIMNASASPFLSLSILIHGVRGSVGGWGLRGLLKRALVWLLYRRLGEMLRRMEGLAARFQAGRLWRVGSRGVAASRGGAVDGGVSRGSGERVWPGGFGWLVRAAGYEAAGFGSQLRAVLGSPEMVALLEASPQAVRVLRPLCRMLAVEASVLRPGGVVAAVAGEVVAARVWVRKARVKVDVGRVPIPRGVMSAVRRGRYGRD